MVIFCFLFLTLSVPLCHIPVPHDYCRIGRDISWLLSVYEYEYEYEYELKSQPGS